MGPNDPNGPLPTDYNTIMHINYAGLAVMVGVLIVAVLAVIGALYLVAGYIQRRQPQQTAQPQIPARLALAPVDTTRNTHN